METLGAGTSTFHVRAGFPGAAENAVVDLSPWGRRCGPRPSTHDARTAAMPYAHPPTPITAVPAPAPTIEAGSVLVRLRERLESLRREPPEVPTGLRDK